MRELSAQGPVFAGGDLNAHYGSSRFPRAGLSGRRVGHDVRRPRHAAGSARATTAAPTIDYLMYQPAAGVTSTSQWKTELLSDHDAVAGDFHLDW